MIDCCVIRDLLPLYEDREVGAETAQAIREHLDGCADCREYYSHVRHVVRAMQEPEPNSASDYRYSEIVRRIRRRDLVERVVGAALLTAAGYGLLKRAFRSDDD